jgi:hypothetical protein
MLEVKSRVSLLATAAMVSASMAEVLPFISSSSYSTGRRRPVKPRDPEMEKEIAAHNAAVQSKRDEKLRRKGKLK